MPKLNSQKVLEIKNFFFKLDTKYNRLGYTGSQVKSTILYGSECMVSEQENGSNYKCGSAAKISRLVEGTYTKMNV